MIKPKVIVNIMLLVVALISFFVIIGYAIKLPYLITWTGSPMAINTALCFFIQSCAILVMNNKKYYGE